jgi:hypothetical protein
MGDIPVTWYVLKQEDETTIMGRGFTKDELDRFLGFINSRPHNFPGGKNRFKCTEEENFPFCSMFSLIPSESLNKPQNIILRKSPQLSPAGEIYYCMDIILTDQRRNDHHNFNLDFDIIGSLE